MSKPEGNKRGRSDEETTPLQRLRALLERARDDCRLLQANTASSADIERVLELTGVVRIHVSNADTNRIRREIGTLTSATFPLLSDRTHASLRMGDFGAASNEWSNRKVKETGMALRSYRMPSPIPLVAARQCDFTDPVLKTVHLRNPLLAMAPLRVWECLRETNPMLHPSNWFRARRMICSEDGIKFANHIAYDPTKIHYDGQPERVQIMFTADTGPVCLYAVPGSGTLEAQALISEILGINMLGGFSTHAKALDAHPEVRDLMHEFGVPGQDGLLCWKTRVWHFEGSTNRQVFDWAQTKTDTKKSDVFRVYCGVVALGDERRDQLIRHAFLREHNWPMEPFAHCNRQTPVFVAEKSSQAAEREAYANLLPEWRALQRFSLQDMKQYLREQVPPSRLLLHGLFPQDLI